MCKCNCNQQNNQSLSEVVYAIDSLASTAIRLKEAQILSEDTIKLADGVVYAVFKKIENAIIETKLDFGGENNQYQQTPTMAPTPIYIDNNIPQPIYVEAEKKEEEMSMQTPVSAPMEAPKTEYESKI